METENLEKILETLINKRCNVCVKGWWHSGILLKKDNQIWAINNGVRTVLFILEDITKPIEVDNE